MGMEDVGSRFALDMQGLQRLKHSARQDPSAGVRGAAQQFEALFIQMMLKSMRDAVPTTGLIDSKQTAFYQSLLDQQWSQTMATRGIGLADSLVAQLEGSGMVPARQQQGSDIDDLIAGIPRGAPRPLRDALRPQAADDEPEPVEAAEKARVAEAIARPESFLDELETASAGFMERLAAVPAGERAAAADRDAVTATGQATRAGGSDGAAPDHVQAFLDRLSGPARAASRTTGVPAELILAQAALETGWGRHEIATREGGNSHNLFGIKAGSGWQGPTTEVTTHEYLDGRRTKVIDSFRVYDSFEAAFTDHARLIGDNPRYARVTAAPDAEQAARELQAGGYATDPAYADKLIAVMDTLEAVEPRGGESLVFFSY
ncbi:flagellar assembly peptidoglycan hydrolase FlgJ [Halomonas sp. LBP4]|uniref:flagellar assembly peptidoglycan hydrolase FlgJ n=1 Tax=Halomonas sp. LBP4 TaxID=2044917 RepID=UPI000D76AABB|nr:flagellar assembly peptidoglycan hydrolase FlgJ [Halomonas sp. LBP4]PXX96463.1 flagellar assembly peptidoglycan hydrolase FlgJ [Halomonas sp. LBP4]